MDQNFQTSFIPKKPMIEQRATPSRRVGLLTVIAFFIFFSVIWASGGLYFWKKNLTTSIAKMNNDLNLSKNRFESSKITELQNLDKRLRASSEILSKHVTIPPIFDVLQAVTMKSVRYTNFSYDIDEKNSKVTVRMKGQAVGYRSIALQADLFTKNKHLIDPIFSNLSLDEKGNVLFDLDFSVDPTFVNYKQVLANQSTNVSDIETSNE
jgi:hypothetical protein